MDQFGIDLDKLLNDFEEQENMNEIVIERAIDKKDGILIGAFCSGNISDPYERFCEKSPSKDVLSLDSFNPNISNFPVGSLPNDITSDIIKNKTLDVYIQESLVGSCIWIENLKPLTLKNASLVITLKDEDLTSFNLLEAQESINSIVFNNNLSRIIENRSFKEELSRITVESESFSFVAESLETNVLKSLDGNVLEFEDSIGKHWNVAGAVKKAVSGGFILDPTNTLANVNNGLCLSTKSETNLLTSGFYLDTDIHEGNLAPLEKLNKGAESVIKSGIFEDNRIQQEKHDESFPKNTTFVKNCLSQQKSNGEDRFMRLSDSEKNDHMPMKSSSVAFIDIGTFNFSDSVSEEECKNNDIENDPTLRNLKLEADEFIEEHMKNRAITFEACEYLQQDLHDNLKNSKNQHFDDHHLESKIRVQKSLEILKGDFASNENLSMNERKIISKENELSTFLDSGENAFSQVDIFNEPTVIELDKETVNDNKFEKSYQDLHSTTVEATEVPSYNQEKDVLQSSRPNPPGSLQFSQPQFFHAPSRCSNIDLPITELGKVSPPWLPDASTSKCLQCETPFSFLRRRHHCRACGLVFCNECCNVRYPLDYMNKKDGRVCCKCFVDFNRASSYLNMLASMSIPTSIPNHSFPDEYCSNIPPPLQVTPTDNLPPVMVPSGVLRKQGTIKHPSESKQVMFSDGIRPGGDLVYLDERSEGTSTSGMKKKSSKFSRSSLASKKQNALNTAMGNPKSTKVNQGLDLFCTKGALPPLATYSAKDFGYVLEWNTSSEVLFRNATDADITTPIVFGLNANLLVLVKVIKKMCCVKRDLWCFSTQGMSTVGQEELIILMEFNQSETTIPLDIFQAISLVYNSAHKGSHIKNMGSIILQDVFGFLFINHTIQCIQNILLPPSPYLFGIFIKQAELTWARAFPLRLFFRLGAEFRYYPCPLFGVRERPPVYGDIGHTIMNLLADFRNFQYSLSTVDDMVIHVEEKYMNIYIPKHKHHQVLKAISNSDDHVLAMAGNFSSIADSHLICTQNSEGSYQTQALNIQGKHRNVTGASFVVFNGALKTSSGYSAKMSIIEDGLMIQITPDSMVSLKHALATSQDFTIDCSFSSQTSNSSPCGEAFFDGKVSLTWFSNQVEKNSDIKSPIDELNLSWSEHKIIHSSCTYSSSVDGFTIVWSGLFFISLPRSTQTIRPEIESFSSIIAPSCCKCLTPHISSLCPPTLSKLSIRIRTGPDQIGYEAGVNGSRLNNECLVELDNILVPLLHSSSLANQSHETTFELLFIIVRPIKF